MKLNNRGITLVELLISIALIAVVMMFMFKLLIDITNEQNNDVFAKNNQTNRAEIIKKIENDFINYGLRNVETSEKLRIKFTFENNKTSILTVASNTLTYIDYDGKTQKWTIEDASAYTEEAFIKCESDGLTKNGVKSVIISVQIHTTNEKNDKNNNNTLDDIILTYVGDKSKFTGVC